MSIAAGTNRTAALRHFRQVRQASLAMCAGLEAAEYRLQPMEDVSPPWWNLGHTSWFFARNVLGGFGGRRTADDDAYDYLLNSYYASLGDRLPRGRRGSLSRPTTDEIYRYRASVDERVEELLRDIDSDRCDEMLAVLRIGIEHEQQHQELFYTEIKHILAQNPRPFRRAYADIAMPPSSPLAVRYHEFLGGLQSYGNVEGGWCWDNELPVHDYFLPPFALANRLVTCGEYQQFMDDGGYGNQLLWLDNGWRHVVDEAWCAPEYWERVDGQWQQWTLGGWRSIDPYDPVCHMSFYEADAFARWRSETFPASDLGVRLPSEREWEHAARMINAAATDDAFLDGGLLHPTASAADQPLTGMLGQVWQWTTSYYEPYPGYRPFPGVLAEYNGKFMDNQRVMRGGSCVTPRDHFRRSYRNFWPAATRFQFTGMRLARDVE